ncbi:hypothetical protein PT974_02040 [Cladobotryum mycophilum]|uniref:Uncharacterized protein n=1 Tax=Cladobotryum mycophilum TaxID=491253 RepID=A0ABR0SWZ5_9HYPO
MGVLPKPQPAQGTKVPWWTGLLTVTTIAFAIIFHLRWTRPINLPMRRYTFVNHPDSVTLTMKPPAIAGPAWSTMNGGTLFAIREEFVQLATEETRAARAATLNVRDVPTREKRKIDLILNRNHLEHCFDFLRQDILCASDLTLEPLDPGYVQSDGQGVEHECKDWRLLLNHVGLQDVDEI